MVNEVIKDFWETLKCEIVEQTNDFIVVEMVIDAVHQRNHQIVHGGAIGALIDFAMTNLLNQPASSMTDYKINFLKMGDGARLVARARRLVVGNLKSPIYCEIFNENEQLIADATGRSGMLEKVIDGEIDSAFQFEPLLNRKVPAHVFEEDGTIPFNDYLGIKQTYWSNSCAQVELHVEQRLETQDGQLPTAHFITLVDVACGQALKTVMAPGENLLTIELSVSILSRFDEAKKLIARGRVRKHGKLATISSVILNEQSQLIAHGTTTYYIKR